MSATARSIAEKADLPPGALVHVGRPSSQRTHITVLDYDQEGLNQVEDPDQDHYRQLRDSERVTWFRVNGVHQVEVIRELGEIFSLHPLVVEDVLNTLQRPKLEDYENYLFAAARSFSFDPQTLSLNGYQVSLILGPGWVLSFEESGGDQLSGVDQRVHQGRGRIRRMGADYLAYSLMDAVVDDYFQVLEAMGESLERLEEQVLDNPTPASLEGTYRLKRAAISLRRSIWPLREAVTSVLRGDSDLVHEGTRPFWQDLHDHLIQVLETCESLRENLSSLMDIYLTSVNNRMNQVMKVLTVIATIFIPLTLLSGIYGMNFKYMPELEWKWAYPVVIGVMVTVGAGMLVYFKRKNWF